MRRIGRPRRVVGNFSVGIVAAALVVAPVLGPAGPAAAVGPEPSVILASDFESGDAAPWEGRGAAVAVADGTAADPAHGGSRLLSVSGRTQSWHGAQADVSSLFEVGVTYAVSGWVRLPAGTEATGIHFAVQRQDAEGAGQYDWIGDFTPVTADDGWVEIGGSYTLPEGSTAPLLYLEAQSATAGFLVDDVLVLAEAAEPGGQVPGTVLVDSDFDDGTLQGWAPRNAGVTDHTVTLVEGGAEETAHAVEVSGRDDTGDGLQYDVTGLAVPGSTYEYEAWLRFADGAETGDLTLSAHVVTGTGDDADESWVNLHQIEGVGNEWTKVGAQFTVPASFDTLEIYVETRYNRDNLETFLVDQVTVWVPEPPVVDLTLTPLKDTLDYPAGVAIDSRETAGHSAELLLHHFDQVTAENHMKVDSWYDGTTFRLHPEARAVLDFAVANDLTVYGHVLVWHTQVPDWWFDDAAGNPLTAQALDDRLRDHIDNVAAAISDEYGPFGSEGNPVVAFDVVNEAIDDSAAGLRNSEWLQIMGPDYIPKAFQYAEEAFNGTYADPAADRPVALFINDYDTEKSGKQDNYYTLVTQLLADGVPLDGVGHQFHLPVTTPVSALDVALARFADLPVVQAVTELDVTLGTPNNAKRIEQGHFYRDAFDVFRSYPLYSVTVWGLTDNRSWRSEQEPLLFDGNLQAKYAYFGAVGGELPPLIRSANVFGGDLPLAAAALDDVAWRQLPAAPIGDAGAFGLRWTADHLTVLVEVTDPQADAVQLQLGEQVLTFARDGSGDVPGIAGDTATGWRAVIHVPLDGVGVGDEGSLDVRVLAAGEVLGAWNSPGELGVVAFLEDLSFVEVVEAAAPPAIDAAIDPVWEAANAVRTETNQPGSDPAGAKADVRTLWSDDVLYVLAEVTDPVIDLSSGDNYQKDSVEIFVDAGNAKNGTYRLEDAQIRISAENGLSFGSGDTAENQAARVTSATALTETGYVVEAAITLLGHGGLDTFQGLDFQVNDAVGGGVRTSAISWAEPTGTGYQTTARWGVGHLVAASDTEPGPPLTADELTDANRGSIDLPAVVRQAATLTIPLGSSHANEQVEVWLYSDPVLVPTEPTSKKGRLTVTLPADVTGEHKLAVFGADRELIGWDTIVVLGAGDPAVNVAPPAITGKAVVGKTLKADPGAWAPDKGLKYGYQWQRDGVDIRKATGKTYTVQKADAGHRLTVVVTASAKGIASASATSQPVTVQKDTKPGKPGHDKPGKPGHDKPGKGKPNLCTPWVQWSAPPSAKHVKSTLGAPRIVWVADGHKGSANRR